MKQCNSLIPACKEVCWTFQHNLCWVCRLTYHKAQSNQVAKNDITCVSLSRPASTVSVLNDHISPSPSLFLTLNFDVQEQLCQYSSYKWSAQLLKFWGSCLRQALETNWYSNRFMIRHNKWILQVVYNIQKHYTCVIIRAIASLEIIQCSLFFLTICIRKILGQPGVSTAVVKQQKSLQAAKPYFSEWLDHDHE